MARLRNALWATLQVSAALAGTSAVLLAFSEYIFLNEGPVESLVTASVAGQRELITAMWGFYLIPATLWLACLRLAAPHSWARVILAGALVGWSIEAAIVPAVYEAPPFSYLWPSVIWHGFVDVAFGLVLLPLALGKQSRTRRFILCCATLAVVWPVWSTWIWIDGPEAMLTPDEFLNLAIWVLILLIPGLWAISFGTQAVQRMPRWIAWLFVAPSVALFALYAVPFWVFALPLAALMAITVWILGPAKSAPFLPEPMSLRRLAIMMGSAALAVPIYAVLFTYEITPGFDALTSSVVIFGTLGFAWALWRGFTDR